MCETLSVKGGGVRVSACSRACVCRRVTGCAGACGVGMRECRVGPCAGVVSAGGGMRVSACLRVSAVDRLCGCVCEARRAGECLKEMLRG